MKALFLCLDFMMCMVILISGYIVGYRDCAIEFQRECIRRDVADHNPQTGEWQWKCVPADETIQPVRLEN